MRSGGHGLSLLSGYTEINIAKKMKDMGQLLQIYSIMKSYLCKFTGKRRLFGCLVVLQKAIYND